MDNRYDHTRFVKDTALRLGFDYCGIAKAERLDEDAIRLENWLKQGMHGSMTYMENHFDKRVDPSLLVPGAKSVITVLKNYYPADYPPAGYSPLDHSSAEHSSAQHSSADHSSSDHSSTKDPAPDRPRISKYALGKDYHEVIRAQMNEFLSLIRDRIGEVNGRGFVDSAPVMERSWARKSGIGWVGKNGNLITKDAGSFFFIATLITDLDLNYDDPFAKDFCGTCTRCIDSCPTQAILPNKVINGSQCISYFTIELKELLIPDEMKGRFSNWAFGCDTCQDVCPWNRFSKPHREEQFNPLPELLNLSSQEWEQMNEENFRRIFRHSPIKRTKWQGIQRNIRFLKEE